MSEEQQPGSDPEVTELVETAERILEIARRHGPEPIKWCGQGGGPPAHVITARYGVKAGKLIGLCESHKKDRWYLLEPDGFLPQHHSQDWWDWYSKWMFR